MSEIKRKILTHIVEIAMIVALLVAAIAAVVVLTTISKNYLAEQEIALKHDIVCNNLDYIVNGRLVVYPEIINMKSVVEKEMEMHMTEIFEVKTAQRWDNNGVMCKVTTEMCRYDELFCIDVKTIIAVNYTEWEDWKEKLEVN